MHGRGRGQPHKPSGSVQNAIPIFVFDYLCICKKESESTIFNREERFAIREIDKEEVAVKVLVAKYCETNAVFAYCFKRKGVDEDGFAVECLRRGLRWPGHTRIIPKSGNGTAIAKLPREALKVFRIEVSQGKDATDQRAEAHPPPYDTSGNGSVEYACRDVQGYLGTLKSRLEQRLQKKITIKHTIFAWLVERASWLLTVRQKCFDVVTKYVRSRGKHFTKRTVGFGEACFCKVPTKIRNDQEEGKMGPGWRHGFFLGYYGYIYLDVLGDSSRCARDGQRRPLSERWNLTVLESISKAPHGEHAPRELRVAFREGAADPPEQRQATTGKVRDLHIRMKGLEDFGYTDSGCPRCGWALRYGYEAKTILSHPHECRQRTKQSFEKTEEGKRRLQDNHDRLDIHLAKKRWSGLTNNKGTRLPAARQTTKKGSDLQAV